MNNLGISLIWLIGQVTLLCSVTAVIYLIARRRHPAAGATAALSGLLLAAVLTLLVVSPWPRWTGGDEQTMSADQLRSATGRDRLPTLDASLLLSGEDNTKLRQGLHDESKHTTAWHAIWHEVQQAYTAMSQWKIPPNDRRVGWLAVALLSIVAIGALRLLAGWLAVQRCLRRSEVIHDRDVSAMIKELQATLSCHDIVELRESHEIASAATVGWRQPIILLPREWREWSPAVRRMVLAHELAHIHARDAATWLAAQFSVLLHFYHPLMHWLLHRLRLEQELAADAVAARLAGGSNSYLTTLAELAVRQPDRPVPWPARAFLPTQGTLLRRIEMLRDTKAHPARTSNVRRGIVVALTLVTTLVVAGLRPTTSTTAVAQAKDVDTSTELSNDEITALKTQSRNNLKQLGLALHNYHATHGHFPPAVLLGPDGKTQYSWRIAVLPFVDEDSLYKQYDRNQPWDSEQNRKVLAQMPAVFRSPMDDKESTNTSYFALTGEHTALGDTPGEGVNIEDITDGTAHTVLITEAKRDILWTKPQDIPYSAEGEIPKLGGFYGEGFYNTLGDASARFLPKDLDETVLRKIITRDGGETIDWSKIDNGRR